MYSLIVCTDGMGGIGNSNTNSIPWPSNKADMKNFKRLTTDNIVIMGRKTWESLPKRPLPNRLNVVISSSLCYPPEGVLVYRSVVDCLVEMSKKKYSKLTKYIIGGATIYNYFMEHKLVEKIYHTKIRVRDREEFEEYPLLPYCDISINIITFERNWRAIKNSSISQHIQYSDTKYRWSYMEYEYINHEEQAFLDTITKVLRGEGRMDRTGTGTIALFAPPQLEFDLTNNAFPLGTTRQMGLRLIFEELMWFLRGQTDASILEAKKVGIWTPNTTREFLDSRGLQHYAPGDMGPTYSFMFRHFGAEYVDCKTDYTGQGYDQLSEVISLLKHNPTSRRIVISLWNPNDLDKMSLPPCAYQYQFYVDNDNGLTTKITQRSSDIITAGLWNIASGSLLTYMLARVCGLTPKRLVWSTGDTHIYKNLVEAAVEQKSRTPRRFPILFFTDDAPTEDITAFEFSDLLLLNYNPHPRIKVCMNV